MIVYTQENQRAKRGRRSDNSLAFTGLSALISASAWKPGFYFWQLMSICDISISKAVFMMGKYCKVTTNVVSVTCSSSGNWIQTKLGPLLININTGFCRLSRFSVGSSVVLAECLYPGSEPSLICPTNHRSLHNPTPKRTSGWSMIRAKEAATFTF